MLTWDAISRRASYVTYVNTYYSTIQQGLYLRSRISTLEVLGEYNVPVGDDPSAIEIEMLKSSQCSRMLSALIVSTFDTVDTPLSKKTAMSSGIE